MAITPLQDYEKACNRLKDAFIKSLYPDSEERGRILVDEEGYWIGNSIGEVYGWWDWFAHSNNMADYFKYKLTPDEFFDWYDRSLEKKSSISMKSYKLKNLKF